ncbi:MAG: class I SAM-dependent RNA methyltransferase [Proteobacteria bacterium]|nr:class I SAM-dependent RNA methyltransferase [Pseudomonadota bacterium]MCP4919278.1 class I SAM-dependent RNA methyltransferase [Pseudomonadota bacterium]
MPSIDRLSQLLDAPVTGRFPSPRAEGYRARIDVVLNRDGLACRTKPKSHELERLTYEPLARDEVNAVLADLPPLRGLSRLSIRTDGKKVVLNGTAKKSRDRAKAALGTTGLPAALEGKAVHGDPQLWLNVEDLRMRVSAGSFYQVNLEVNALLVAYVRAQVLAFSPSRVLDLYAGIGNLSLPLADQGVECTLIEVAGSAMRDARDTAKRHGLSIDARTADAGRFRAGDAFFDVAVLDPPRAGAPGVIEQLVVTRPAGLVYVSCNPSTLERDLRKARAAGYRLTGLAVFEMFPGTPHQEAVATLSR